MRKVVVYARRITVDDAGNSLLAVITMDEDEILQAIQEATGSAIRCGEPDAVSVSRDVTITVKLRDGHGF